MWKAYVFVWFIIIVVSECVCFNFLSQVSLHNITYNEGMRLTLLPLNGLVASDQSVLELAILIPFMLPLIPLWIGMNCPFTVGGCGTWLPLLACHLLVSMMPTDGSKLFFVCVFFESYFRYLFRIDLYVRFFCWLFF